MDSEPPFTPFAPFTPVPSPTNSDQDGLRSSNHLSQKDREVTADHPVDQDASPSLEIPQEVFDSTETQAKYDEEGLEDQRYEKGTSPISHTTLTILTA